MKLKRITLTNQSKKEIIQWIKELEKNWTESGWIEDIYFKIRNHPCGVVSEKKGAAKVLKKIFKITQGEIDKN